MTDINKKWRRKSSYDLTAFGTKYRAFTEIQLGEASNHVSQSHIQGTDSQGVTVQCNPCISKRHK